MKYKTANLEGYVMIGDSNYDAPYGSNIFDDKRLLERIYKGFRLKGDYWRIDSRKRLKEVLKTELMAKYWSRCEYEYIVSEYPKQKNEKKLDVWSQLENNLDALTDYVIYKMDIKFERGE